MAVTLLVLTPAPASAGVASTWDGGGGDGLWSTATNWVGDVLPTAGADLVFPSSAQGTVDNDLLATAGSISFDGTYTLVGDPLTLSSGMTLADSARVTIELEVDGSAPLTVSVGQSVRLTVTAPWDLGSSLVISSRTPLGGLIALVVSGDGDLTVEDVLGLEVTESTSGTGTYDVGAGLWAHHEPTLRDVVSRGLLTGLGAVADLDVLAGTAIPGNPGVAVGQPRILPVNGDLTFASGARAGFELVGPTAPSGNDSYAVAGSVVLGGSELHLSPRFDPPAGTSYRLIDNDGADPVSGTFAGLPEGATVTGGATTYRISYVGGDGNDVVLTALAVPAGTTTTVVGRVPLARTGTNADLSLLAAGLVLLGSGLLLGRRLVSWR